MAARCRRLKNQGELTECCRKCLFAICIIALTTVGLRADDQIPITAGAAILGKGYDSHDQAFKGDCLSYDPTKVLYAGGSGAELGFTHSLSESDAQNALGFGTQGRTSFGVVSASMQADFARSIEADDYSDTVTYQATYSFKNAYFNSSTLQSFAQAVNKPGGGFSSSAFRAVCGDSYVKQIKRGAALFFSVKISFSTKSDKQNFDASFSIQGPLSGISGNLAQASKQFGQSASIQLSAYQLGGRVDRLSTIFANGSSQQQQGSTNAILLCKISNLQPCLDVISKALDYATNTTDPNAFPQQLSPTFDPTQPGGPADLSYVIEPWSDIGIMVPPATVSAIIDAERKQLESILTPQLAYRSRLDDLKQRTFRLSDAQAAMVTTYSAMVDSNLVDILNAATTCYTNDSGCAPAVTTLSAKIAERAQDTRFDPNLLDIQPETFAQWCDYTGYVNEGAVPPTPALKPTQIIVNALVAIARANGVNTQDDAQWAKVSDQCDYSDKILSQLPRIGISNQQLGDLRPLNHFRSLTYLELSGDGIDDATLTNSGIPTLTNLLVLNLSKNTLQRVDDLLPLTNLRVLDVSANHIVDLSTLSGLTHLTVLKATQNPLNCRDTNKCCPLLQVSAVCTF